MQPPPFPPEAFGRTDQPGRAVSDGDGKVFPCRQCGADLTFSIGQQSMHCPYCGYEQELALDPEAEIVEQDYHAMLETLRERKELKHTENPGDKEVRCDACGGTVLFNGTLTSSECPYCASPIQRERIHDAPDRIPVDAVLPFLIDNAQAKKNLKKWIASLWFAPNAFRKKGAKGKFSGVYMPYWTFDSLTFTRYVGERGEHYYVTVGSGKNRRSERRTRWYPASGSFQRFFDDVVVLATKGMDRKLIIALEPWPLGKCIPFTQEVMAGLLARTYDTALDQGFHEGKERMEWALQQEVRSRIGGDTQRIHDMDVMHSAITFKHVLLPVWILAYQYHEKTYQVLVNGATGEVQGHRPYSWVKITFAVLAALCVMALVFFLTRG